jgi:GTP cyclohydrolase IB
MAVIFHTLPIVSMNARSAALPLIPDTQSSADHRQQAIQRVGVRGVLYPLHVRLNDVESTHTVAEWELDVSLPAQQKGTHMSRLVEWLDDLHLNPVPLDAEALGQALGVRLQKLEATEGQVGAQFPFFLRKRAPISGLESLLAYRGGLRAQTRAGQTKIWAEIVVPVKSLCPCSKAIANEGAHNQRSHVTINAELLGPAISWLELARFAEESASSEIWSLLKREDEKWITEHAYANPRFVEDLVREVALRLNQETRIGIYRVDVENFESIHAHSAFARIDRGQQSDWASD